MQSLQTLRPASWAKRSQGGVKLPTGGYGKTHCTSPRAPDPAMSGQGQQTRLDSGADGYSPDKRERDRA
jgi:hypothetical protein